MQEWRTQAWRDEVLAWAAEAGVVPSGTVEQPRVRPWSTLLRIPTTDGTVWMKAGGPACSYEAGLLRAFDVYETPHVQRPLAVDAKKGWLLLPDGGRTLRDVPGTTLADWERALGGYARIQRHLEHRGLPGVPDNRPQVMPQLFDTLLGRLPVDHREDLLALVPRYETWCDELGTSGIVPTIQHDDLHDGNVFAYGDVVFDWGDSSFGFPFGTLLVTLRSAARTFDLAPGAPELVRLRDAYLEAWTDKHSRTELELLALLATRTAKVGRSAAWLRALDGVEDPGEWTEGAPGWLEELLEEDVF